MSSIDNRIVNMQFNNREFEKGIKESIGSLAALEKGLDLDGASKGLAGLQTTANKFSLDGMADSLESVASRFSTLGIIGMTALQELTSAAIHHGGNIARALIDPIVQGGKQRAIDLEQANFMLKGLGMDVKQVRLDAIEAIRGTSYGIGETLKVASQLGASGLQAGKDMETALSGVAGLASMTGASYTDMGRIFATVAGNGRLMGMQLTQLGSHGLNVAASLAKEFNTTEEAIRNSVSKGEISFEMFYQAMANQYGEHAKASEEMFVVAMANLKGAMGKLGGMFYEPGLQILRDILIALRPVVDNLNAVMQPFAKVLMDFLGVMGAKAVTKIEKFTETFVGMGNIFENLFGGDKLDARTSRAANTFWNLANGLQDFAKIFVVVKDILKIAWGSIKAVISAFSPILHPLAALFGVLGEQVSHFSEAWQYADPVSDIIDKVRIAVEKIAKPIIDVTNAIVNFIFEMFGWSKIGYGLEESNIHLGKFGELADKAAGPIKKLGDAFKNLKEKFDPIKAIGGAFTKVIEGIKSGSTNVLPFLSNIGIALLEGFKNLDFSKVGALINIGILTVIYKGIKTFFNSLNDIAKSGEGFIKSIRSIFDGVTQTLSDMQNKLKAETLLKIAGAIGILALALVVLSGIDPEKLTSALLGMGVLLAEVVIAMKALETTMGKFKLKGLISFAAALVTFSVSILLLAFGLKMLAKLEMKEMVTGLLGVAGLSVILVEVAKTLSANKGKMMKGATGLIAFAGAMWILAVVVKKLGELDMAVLAKGLISVIALVVVLAKFLKTANFDSFGLKSGLGLIGLATAITILAKAVKVFGELDTGALLKGLAALATVLLAIGIFVNQTSEVKGVFKTAVGLVVLGAAMHIFAGAIKKLGSMKAEDLAKGLGALGLALLGVGVALNHFPEGAIGKAASLVIAAGALAIVGSTLRKLGGLEWDELAKGLIGIGGAMLILVVGLNALQYTTAGSASLVVASVALALLVPVMKALSGLSWEEIAKGLVAMAGAFTVVGVATALLSPLIIPMMGLAAAMALLGVAAMGAGAGALLFATAIDKVVTAGGKGLDAMVRTVTSLLDLVPYAFVKLGEGILAFAGVITEGAPALVRAFVVVFDSILTAIIEITPKIVQTVGVLIDGVIEILEENVPKMFNTGMDLLISLIDGLNEKLPELIDAGVRALISFLAGLSKNIAEIVDAGFKFIIALINGIAEGIRENQEELRAAGRNIIMAIFEAMLGLLGDAIKIGWDLGGELIKGLKDNIPTVKEAGAFIASKGLEAINKVKGWWQAGVDFIKGFTDGMRSEKYHASEAAKEIAVAAHGETARYLEIKSPSRLMERVGASFGQGFIEGISSKEGETGKATESVGKTAFTKFSPGELSTKGSDFIKTFMKGVSSQSYSAMLSAKNVAIRAFDNFKPGNLWQTGVNMMVGFQNGINSVSSRIATAARNVAVGAVNSVNQYLMVQSPSRLMMGIGQHTMEGFAIGMERMGREVADSAKHVARGSVQAMEKAISDISDLISGDMDLDPTIKPILDLSNVTDGLAGLDIYDKVLNLSTARRDAISIDSREREMADKALAMRENVRDTYNNSNITIENMHVREESDIDKIAQQLHTLTLRKGRA